MKTNSNGKHEMIGKKAIGVQKTLESPIRKSTCGLLAEPKEKKLIEPIANKTIFFSLQLLPREQRHSFIDKKLE